MLVLYHPYKNKLTSLLTEDDFMKIDAIVNSLNHPTEREVLKRRYGLCGTQPQKQKEISRDMGFSKAFVGYSQRKGLGRLRSSKHRKTLQGMIATHGQLKSLIKQMDIMVEDKTDKLTKKLWNIELDERRVRDRKEPDLDPEDLLYLLKEINEFDWSARVLNVLKKARIHLIGQLVQKSPIEMLKTWSFGKNCLKEVEENLGKLGLRLKMRLDDETKYMINDRLKELEKETWKLL
jgi:hypothetical protein